MRAVLSPCNDRGACTTPPDSSATYWRQGRLQGETLSGKPAHRQEGQHILHARDGQCRLPGQGKSKAGPAKREHDATTAIQIENRMNGRGGSTTPYRTGNPARIRRRPDG